MAIRRWNPVDDALTLRDAMDQLFQESFVRPRGWMGEGAESGMMPMDIYEEDDTLVVKTSMPGLKAEDIDIRIEGDTLTITGELKSEQEQPKVVESTTAQPTQTKAQQGQAKQPTQAMTAAPSRAMEQGKRNWYMREHRITRYARSVTLPYPVDQDKAEATFEQGVLTLRLPKAEQARAKKISIKS